VKSADPLFVLETLRAICLALPAARETVTFGHPTFQAGKKTFAVLEEYRGELCIVFKAELPVQQALIQSPRFFSAPYVGKKGWVSLRATGALDWKEIGDLVLASYRLLATPAMASALDARRRGRDPSVAKTSGTAQRRHAPGTSGQKSGTRTTHRKKQIAVKGAPTRTKSKKR
jgi:predicted DNA-binding protein (MmcQ/YjbR family)